MACFTVGKLLSKFSHFAICVFSLGCGVVYTLLFAAPIPTSTSYWAYGFPAMCLCGSIDLFAPTITLYIIGMLPRDEQSLGGGLFTAANQIGRSIGPALATAIQTSVEQEKEGNSQRRMLISFRAAQSFNCALVFAGLAFFAFALRDMDSRRRS